MNNFTLWPLSIGWCAITVGAYAFGAFARRLAHEHPLANPVLIAIGIVGALLVTTGTTYDHYFQGTWPLSFLLAPATVALGLPLAQNFVHVRRSLRGIALGLLAGCFSSMICGVACVLVLGGNSEVALSMLPKAVTTPIAIAVAADIGGKPPLTASLAILGGIIAAVSMHTIFRLLRITEAPATGLAAGTAGSGIGAAQIALSGHTQAAFAAIGIGLNGLLTAIAAPWLAQYLR